jgi:5-methylcytosine-specific restriction protein A
MSPILKPCAQPGCPELIAKGARCPEHHKAFRRKYDRGYRRRQRKKLYDSARWQKVRRMILRREPICRECKARPATEVHHINNNPLDNRDDNFEPLCKPCHSRRTAHETGFGRHV